MLPLGKLKPIPVKLDEEIRARMANLAKTRKHSVHALMKEAIYEYVDREEKRHAFYQEALRSWEDYRETGLHITSDEAIEWLATWGTDKKAAARSAQAIVKPLQILGSYPKIGRPVAGSDGHMREAGFQLEN